MPYRRSRRPTLAQRIVRSTVIVVAIAIVILALFLVARGDASGPICEYGTGACVPPITATSVPPPTTTTSTTTPESPGLPFTGGDVGGLAAYGALAAGAGAYLLHRSRR